MICRDVQPAHAAGEGEPFPLLKPVTLLSARLARAAPGGAGGVLALHPPVTVFCSLWNV